MVTQSVFASTGKSLESTPFEFRPTMRVVIWRTLSHQNGAISMIYLSAVLAAYRASGLSSHSPYFDLTYRKAEGVWGSKTSVCRRAGLNPGGKKDLVSIMHESRQAGKLYLVDSTGYQFELHIPLLEKFNGKTIDHRF
ncbi:hypothetical protein GCM10028818_01240 [Spirosoma horti]